MSVFTGEAIAEATAIRQQLHSHPELKYEEHATADLVAAFLRRHGYEVRTGVAGTGVVALLDTGRPGPTIGLRADMDALPILEDTELPYASRTPGKMHACGHDGHTASLLLAAGRLARHHDHLCGRIKLLFQPAEEGGLGAERMIEEGALEGVEAIFGYHNRPGYPLGRVFAKAGPSMGGSSLYEVTISGKGGHASRPDLAIDPIFVGAAVVQALQGVVGRRLSPLESGVVTVTQFHGGNSQNVIPGQATLMINTRDGSPAAAAVIDETLRRVVAQVCQAHGASAELVRTMRIPALVNDAAETALVVETAIDALGADKAGYMHQLPTMGAEDFAFYLEKVPGCYFFVGNGEDGAYLHHPHYDYRDEILPVAAGMFVAIAERRLGTNP
ncbi:MULTISPECIES: amidohydrolase [unclassified Pseudomonas]|uniref:M20 metallopeptidase family protein n=1 Tax=unclassified Pseudomonas TaxID=196821 RepID=UPI000731A5F8|nr:MULTISPECIES: amidohydrolase [unclassified Pseudomonas]KSW22064.1 amidohydrolase [Pseudomonas sp. ADP]OBP10490.1 amidohydrolase [Pseudomonas sp. EGD-AKN5]QOF84847.1 amidohydrolase [Pseudomonas sp. ADPe]